MLIKPSEGHTCYIYLTPVLKFLIYFEILVSSVITIFKTSKFSKICIIWVARNPTNNHSFQNKTISFELLDRFYANGENILLKIATGDQILAHHFQP